MTSATRSGDPFDGPFGEAERRGLRLGLMMRGAALLAIALYLPFEIPTAPLSYYYAILVLSALIGAAPLLAPRQGFSSPWLRYLWTLIDAALVVFAVTVPNPFDPDEFLPLAMRFKLDNVMYPVLFVAFYALTFSPRLVLGAAFSITAFWLLAMAWAVAQPDYGPQFALPDGWMASTPEQKTLFIADPYHLKPATMVKQPLLILLVGVFVAVSVARARDLVVRQARAEQTRANLARYLSPNLVESLGALDHPLGRTRRATVAIMFVDVVGFTRLAEAEPPEATIELLRDLLGRLEAAVFRHGGTLDKYLGDGLMATFGTPVPGPRDAAAALACARDMADAADAWNEARRAAGRPPAEIAIGLHRGPVVLGNIGGEARLEFAVLGDSVNLASRIEEATRALGAVIAISEDMRAAVLAEAQPEEAERLLDGFEPQPPRALRGRATATTLWILARDGTGH